MAFEGALFSGRLRRREMQDEGSTLTIPWEQRRVPTGSESSGVLSAVCVTALSLLIIESFYRFIFQEKNSGVLTGCSRLWL